MPLNSGIRCLYSKVLNSIGKIPDERQGLALEFLLQIQLEEVPANYPAGQFRVALFQVFDGFPVYLHHVYFRFLF